MAVINLFGTLSYASKKMFLKFETEIDKFIEERGRSGIIYNLLRWVSNSPVFLLLKFLTADFIPVNSYVSVVILTIFSTLYQTSIAFTVLFIFIILQF